MIAYRGRRRKAPFIPNSNNTQRWGLLSFTLRPLYTRERSLNSLNRRSRGSTEALNVSQNRSCLWWEFNPRTSSPQAIHNTDWANPAPDIYIYIHTSRKVAGSISNGVIGIFHWHLPHCGPGVDSASNRNEYQEYFLGGKGGRCVGLTTLPPLCADCLEIWEPQPPATLRASPGL